MKIFILRILEGILIGSGAILPGISGGVLCVIFGVYRPLMDFLSSPVKGFKKYLNLFLPILIGWVLGFIIFSKIITVVFDVSSDYATAFFAGLILGTIPSLFKEAGKEGRSVASFVSLGISFAVMTGFFIVINNVNNINITPNIAWFLFCGALWGLSVVIPGLTSASLLIFLGLYQPMTAGIAALDIGVLIPMLTGIVIVVLVTARLINHVFKSRYNISYHAVIGIVLSSTVLIIRYSYNSVWDFIFSLLFIILGIAVSFFIDKYTVKLSKGKQIQSRE